MALTARQFAFFAVRVAAAYIAFVYVRDLPFFFLTQATIPPDDPILMRHALLSVLVWAIGPLIALVLWRRADRISVFMLTGAPGSAAAGRRDRHPWEQSVLTLFGAFVLLNILPTLMNYAVAYLQWVNRPPETTTFETFFGEHLLPAQMASHACQLALSLFLIFRAPTAWRGLQSLQNKSLPQAIGNLRSLGVVKTRRLAESNPRRESRKQRWVRRRGDKMR